MKAGWASRGEAVEKARNNKRNEARTIFEGLALEKQGRTDVTAFTRKPIGLSSAYPSESPCPVKSRAIVFRLSAAHAAAL
jgi:hypothetical protein